MGSTVTARQRGRRVFYSPARVKPMRRGSTAKNGKVTLWVGWPWMTQRAGSSDFLFGLYHPPREGS